MCIHVLITHHSPKAQCKQSIMRTHGFSMRGIDHRLRTHARHIYVAQPGETAFIYNALKYPSGHCKGQSFKQPACAHIPE